MHNACRVSSALGVQKYRTQGSWDVCGNLAKISPDNRSTNQTTNEKKGMTFSESVDRWSPLQTKEYLLNEHSHIILPLF